MAEYVTLYHYTSKEAAKQIERSRKINASSGTIGDVAFGNGVYLTGLPPSAGKADIARNNYDDVRLPLQRMNEKRLDYVIEVVIRKDRVMKCPSSRDIYLYTAGDLYLDGPDVLSARIYPFN